MKKTKFIKTLSKVLQDITFPQVEKIKIKRSELLPSHYTPVEEPSFNGPGNHNVLELEEICEQYKEFVHQLRIREHVILTRGNLEIII